MTVLNIQQIKRDNSERRVAKLTYELKQCTEVGSFRELTIFVTGSYARNEASEHSDIDLFFVLNGQLNGLQEPNITTLRMFAEIVKISQQLGFPKFSNDGEYLRIIEKPKIIEKLGGREDDYENYFTARMLMILESRCVYGQPAYDDILKDILGRYFDDYPDHPREFLPTFLVNDIIRFWKTLCLNYENKRNQPETNPDRKIAQKIKNLKLKFSRMLTCYASICFIVSLPSPIGIGDIISMTELSPLERLRTVVSSRPNLKELFEDIEEQYRWFLELTNIAEADLKAKFSCKTLRTDAFERARKFGDGIFEITKLIAEERNYLRFVLV